MVGSWFSSSRFHLAGIFSLRDPDFNISPLWWRLATVLVFFSSLAQLPLRRIRFASQLRLQHFASLAADGDGLSFLLLVALCRIVFALKP
jgi:predicted lysophospholipase L1 biosynthesis ABC-type transport system permease subunit